MAQIMDIMKTLCGLTLNRDMLKYIPSGMPSKAIEVSMNLWSCKRVKLEGKLWLAVQSKDE
jgi:hypothetical protein